MVTVRQHVTYLRYIYVCVFMQFFWYECVHDYMVVAVEMKITHIFRRHFDVFKCVFDFFSKNTLFLFKYVVVADVSRRFT